MRYGHNGKNFDEKNLTGGLNVTINLKNSLCKVEVTRTMNILDPKVSAYSKM